MDSTLKNNNMMHFVLIQIMIKMAIYLKMLYKNVFLNKLNTKPDKDFKEKLEINHQNIILIINIILINKLLFKL